MPATGPQKVTNGFTPPTPAYCQVDLTYSTMGGPENGYDVGQVQKIKIRVVLPLSAADGGSGGVQGNWNGKVQVSGSPGMPGTLTWSAYTEGVTRDNYTYAIRLGYVGTMTDTGQGNPPFGVIQTGPLAHTLALGTLADWTHRATHYGKDWGIALAEAYYGIAPNRVYYNGCSGGGNMGMGQLQNYGDEYDGFLIGAPAMHWQQFRPADAWPALVQKSLSQIGKSLAQGQIDAANRAAIAACDGVDGVTDGIAADPRYCTFSAAANICGETGAPLAPNCLDADQAAAIDRIWVGPYNHMGKRIYYPYDRGISFRPSTSVGGSTRQVMQYNHKDTTFDAQLLFADAASLLAASSPPGGITYEDEAFLGSLVTGDYMDNANPQLDKAMKHGTKVIHIHGTQDGAIRWRHSVDYYRQVAVYFGKGHPDYERLQDWYRFYMMPGVGHCGGAGVGPSPNDPFLVLEKWVEQGIAPDRIKAEGGSGAPATRSRPLCPYPQWAQYNGTGSTDDWNSYTCGGDLEANLISVCQMPRVKEKHETESPLNTDVTKIPPGMCEHFKSF